MATTIAARAAAASASVAGALPTACGGFETIDGSTWPAAIWGRLPPVRTHTV